MSVTYNWREHSEDREGILSTNCPRCGAELVFHQPDDELPERLLATCSLCKSWFLADSDRESLRLITESLVICDERGVNRS